MRPAMLALAVLAAAPSADARCAEVGLLPTVLAGTADTAIAKDGGIVVGVVHSPDGGLGPGDAAVVKSWRMRVKKALVPPTIESLAPGLAVYRAPAGTTQLELENDKHVVIGKAHVDASAATLPAPKVKKVTATGKHGYHGTVHVQVEVDAVPAGAVAIVAADEKGVAKSWGKVEKGYPLFAYEETGCSPLPNGTLASDPGDRITVFWVDASGRKSPASAPIVVGGKVGFSAE